MSTLPQFWQSRGWRACLLWPVSCLFACLLRLRRLMLRVGILQTLPSRLPVVVVGNLSVGGTGKTPLCAELALRFQTMGWKPAIVSRGYGGQRHEQPHRLNEGDTPESAGDEPVMLYQQTGLPVCVCIDRAAAVECLARETDADIVFSDDGLQHLRMERMVEIVVIDGGRGLGNRWVMPAGPLREPPARLAKASLIAIQDPFTGSEQPATDRFHSSLLQSFRRHGCTHAQEQTFQLRPGRLHHLQSGRSLELSCLAGRRVHAVAGIGNPQRFFDSLSACGLEVVPHPLPDHHQYSLDDLSFGDQDPILLTSKDVVKLQNMADLPDTVYEVATQIRLSEELDEAIGVLERSLRKTRQY